MRGDIGKGKFKPQSDYYYVSIRMAKMKKKLVIMQGMQNIIVQPL